MENCVNIGKRRKGQYLIVEDVLLFGVGIALLVGVASIAVILNSTLLGTVKAGQYAEIANLVAANVQVYKMTGARGQILIAAPGKIAGDRYDIAAYLDETGKDTVVVAPAAKEAAKISAPLPVRGRFAGAEKILLDYDGSRVLLRGSGG